jgi:uncharacterized membrane protein
MHYDTTQDERVMAMVAYLLTFFFPFLGPLVVYLIKKDQSRFVAFHSLQALLLHLVGGVVGFLFWVSGIILAALHLEILLLPVGCIVMPALGLAVVVITLIGLVRSYSGQWYVAPVVGPIAQGMAGV